MVDELIVRDVMTREFVGVSESDTVGDAAALMLEEGESVIAVLRGSEPVGVANARTLLYAMVNRQDPETTTIGTVMQQPPQSLRPDETLADAAAILADAETDHLFVSAGDELLGVLSENDVVTAVTSLLVTDSQSEGEPFRTAAVVPEGGDESMTTQSVCEVCGSLKADLEDVNGQLVCPDCRAM